MSDIKGILLDIDGVVVGEKIGYNSPWPHPQVIAKLQHAREKGIFISLCTAKPFYAIEKIIRDAGLNNLHITDGGAVIIDPIDNTVLKKHVIPSSTVKDILSSFLQKNVYVEFYTLDAYYVQKSQVSDFTAQHTHILQKEPVVVEDLLAESLTHEVIKIMPIVPGEESKKIITEIITPLQNKVMLSWGVHPVALPLQFGIITVAGITKKQAAIDVIHALGLSFEHVLGVGDSTSDWQFIELCRYGGAMGNASDELKQLVMSKGKGHGYIGKSVDENGVLEILDTFFT